MPKIRNVSDNNNVEPDLYSIIRQLIYPHDYDSAQEESAVRAEVQRLQVEIDTLSNYIVNHERTADVEIDRIYHLRQNFRARNTLTVRREEDLALQMAAALQQFEERAIIPYRQREEAIQHVLRARRRIYAISDMRRRRVGDQVMHLHESQLSPNEIRYILHPIRANIPTIEQTRGVLQETCSEAQVHRDLGSSSSDDDEALDPITPENGHLRYSHRRGGLDDVFFSYACQPQANHRQY